MRPNRLAAFGLAAGLLTGSAAGMALAAPGLAGAQTPTATTEPPAPAEKGAWRRDALAPLVEDGTINQAQADAVIGALDAARPARGPHGHRHGHGAGLAAAAVDVLGLSVEDLRSALGDGKSLADVAGENGVDVDAVIGAVADRMRTLIQEKVTAERITEEQADRMLARVTERAAAVVNGERRSPGLGGAGRHRGPRPATAPAQPPR